MVKITNHKTRNKTNILTATFRQRYVWLTRDTDGQFELPMSVVLDLSYKELERLYKAYKQKVK